MSAKLIRIVKRAHTALKMFNTIKTPVTVFRIVTHGYRLDGTVSKVIINHIWYEIIEGYHTVYPFKLNPNQEAEIYVSQQ